MIPESEIFLLKKCREWLAAQYENGPEKAHLLSVVKERLAQLENRKGK